jgi:hypothetical protein
MRFLAAVAALLVASALGGCADAPDPADGPGVVVITDPLQNRTQDPGAQPHLHDYWGGQHRLTLMQETQQTGATWFSPQPISLAAFQPEPGRVVPQGAAWVNLTVGWTEEAGALPPNRYETPQLWVRSPADNEVRLVANLTQNPMAVSIPLTPAMADLPHQVLSAWRFDVKMVGTPDPVFGHWLQFSGAITLQATTDRGLPIEPFPAHPDRWQGRTEIPLLFADGTLFYDGDPTTGNWRCYGGCPVIHHPDDGVVVPVDAEKVTLTLATSGPVPALRLGLKFHGADTREWAVAPVATDGETERTYEIVVGPTSGDGPYARQSQWEFVPYVEGPVENGHTYQEYSLTAKAHRRFS